MAGRPKVLEKLMEVLNMSGSPRPRPGPEPDDAPNEEDGGHYD